MKRKGVNYDVGIETGGFNLRPTWSRPKFDIEVVSREIAIIKNDLNCNAIRISGTDPDRLMAATEIALGQDLEVWLSPHLHDKDAEETLSYTIACAEKAERLRPRFSKLVFVLGCELTLFMQGLLPGNTIFERVGSPSFMDIVKSGGHNKLLRAFLSKAVRGVRNVYQGEVTYASAPLEAVDWSMFDYVGLDYYRASHNKPSYANKLKSFHKWNKPVIVTEFGCCAYQGADQAGGRGWMIVEHTTPKRLNGEYVRDEALQARELTEQLTILDDAGVEGAFVFTFIAPVWVHDKSPLYDLDMASYALVKSYADGRGERYPDMTWEPKQSFEAVARYYAQH
ncbi:hypothetical protein [Paenibacillus hamazuiensis]|uniref:hypothetical protein n=1 Tax=Paenibacillus hamazuiensis TaxID=2936508 RepID=UPI00200DFF17|nr:hypothetical protein [Paenibacillus hamazuiensis]